MKKKTKQQRESDLCDLEQVTLKPQLEADHWLSTKVQMCYHNLLWGISFQKRAPTLKSKTASSASTTRNIGQGLSFFCAMFFQEIIFNQFFCDVSILVCTFRSIFELKNRFHVVSHMWTWGIFSIQRKLFCLLLASLASAHLELKGIATYDVISPRATTHYAILTVVISTAHDLNVLHFKFTTISTKTVLD